ncbi:MAG: M48 family metallopeptidase [Tepidisphaeraceae bacterium]
MDFFGHQDRARGRTVKFLVLYGIAVVGVLLSLNVVGMLVYYAVDHSNQPRGKRTYVVDNDAPTGVREVREPAPPAKPFSLWQPQVYGTTSAIVLVIIGLSGIVKQLMIGGDGASVAESLGGKLVDGNTTDLEERKLINIVEEMSIASGVPVPRLYVLNAEEGINAFAAGTRPDNAVVAVTRGCIRNLNRDQLQGVVAHEFSHILNGDMRLNLRMIALNFGIMALGVIGYWVMRLGFEGAARSSKKEGAGAALGFAIVGLLMMIVGYVGVFFGNMIQAAISRQREFLADASAVQFTRNPSGIAGALKKIGGLAYGSKLKTAAAGEASHMFFARVAGRS